MRRRCVVALATLLAGPALGQPTPTCPGDCNRDGVVRVSELVQGVAFFLAGEPPDGCDELDDNRDGEVRVNELVLAVAKALGECRLTGDDAGEASAQAGLGTTDAFEVIDLGSASAGGAGEGGGLAPIGAGALAIGGVPGQACNGGGRRDETCEIRSNMARLTVVFDACTIASDAFTQVLDGRTVRTVDDPTFCTTRVVEDGAAVMDAFTDFRRTLTRHEEGGESTVELHGTFTRRIVFDGASCAGRSAAEELDGTLAFRCTAPADSLVCPPEGRDVAVTVRNLNLLRDGLGEPGDCTRTKTVSGRVELRDGISGQQFDALYRQFMVGEDVRGTGEIDVQLLGGFGMDCLGEAGIVTEVPVRRTGNARCPSAGLFRITLPDGTRRGVRYTAGRLQLDLDGDQEFERQFDSCEDPTLAMCQ